MTLCSVNPIGRSGHGGNHRGYDRTVDGVEGFVENLSFLMTFGRVAVVSIEFFRVHFS